MRSYALNEARADFSKVFERALAGEPQRITRYGKEAVVLVSEAEWKAWASEPGNGSASGKSLTLADVFEKFGELGVDDDFFDHTLFKQTRPLGADFDDDA